MVPIIEVSDETLRTLNPKVYTLRNDLEDISMQQIVDLNTKGWIKVPQEFSGLDYDFSVSPARLSYSSVVKKVASKLGLTLGNTAADSLGRSYIGNINWSESLKINLLMGNQTPTLSEFNNFGKLLYKDMKEKIKVYAVNGRELDTKFLENVFEDIYYVKSPLRVEWLDADFKVKDGKFYINYNHIFDSNGNLIPQNSEILDEETLMENQIISLENWLENPTKQGFPMKKIKSGGLYYWCPRDDKNSVVRFYAVSDRSGFNCRGDPSDRSSSCGVWAVRHE